MNSSTNANATTNESVAVTMQILDKEYRIACPVEERDNLLASAQRLNEAIKDIRDSGKVVGADRILVMAALNITHELLQHHSQKDGTAQALGQRIKVLQHKVDGALYRDRQLEL